MLEALKRHLSTFWGASLVIHSLIISCVLFIRPVREAIFGGAEKQTELTVEGERLNQIVSEARRLTAAKLARRARVLWDIFDQMDLMRGKAFGRLQGTQGVAAVAAIRKGFQDDDGAGRPEDLLGRSLPEVVGTAKRMEDRTAVAYQHVRAATLAMMQDVTIDEAMKTAKVDRPQRQPLDAAILTEPIYTTRRLHVFRRELKTAENELDGIIAYARKMLDQAERLEDLEDEGGITLAMYESYGGGATAGSTLMPWEIYDSGRPTGLGNVQALPGRKVTPQGRPTEWMFIDTWYVIGPFANDRRDNLNTKFLPETVVDLDAVYPGRENKEVRWEYVKSSKILIDPPQAARYSIWYAFTEIYCEEETQLWVAVGGDDFCKFWVNDELMWVSSETPKPYYALEHLQIVHLRKGFNRILFRLENAGGTTGFSVLVCTKMKA